MKDKRTARDEVAIILAKGTVSLILIIALGAFGRSFYLAIVTHQDKPISQAATQLLTSLGSALVGGAVGFTGGMTQRKEIDKPTVKPTQP